MRSIGGDVGHGDYELRVSRPGALVVGCFAEPRHGICEDNSRDAAAITPAPVGMRAPAVPSILNAGLIRGTLTATPTVGRYSAGTSDLRPDQALKRVDREARHYRGGAAGKPEHGEIVGSPVPGSTRTRTAISASRILKAARKGRDRSLLVDSEIAQRRGKSAEQAQADIACPERRSATRRTTRPASQAHPPRIMDTAELTGRSRTARAAIHAALRQIGEAKGNRLRDIGRGERRRPENRCGRESGCSAALPKAPHPPDKKHPTTSRRARGAREVREIFVEAGRLLRSGYDPDLGLNGRYSFTLSRHRTTCGNIFPG